MRKNELLPIGAFVRFNNDPVKVFKRIKDAGFSHCQLAAPSDDYLYGKKSKVMTRNLLNVLEENEITVTSVFMSFPGQNWNLSDAPNSIGLVPETTRAERIARACRIGNWAKELGVNELAAHVGFVPEDRNCELYKKFIDAMRVLVLFLQSNDQTFTFETGQETVAVLSNIIEDIGTDNLGINFDPANLLLYDRDEPSYLVEKLGKYVVHIHCKDGVRPQQKGTLGKETRLGEGDVGFESLLRNLYAIGFRGPLTIEREATSGEQQDKDILFAKDVIERIKKDLLK